MKAMAIVEKDKNGKYHVYSKNLKTFIIGEGDTVQEALDDFQNTTQEIISCYTPDTLPKELKNLTFEYRYDLNSFFCKYNFINMTKLSKHVGICDSLMRRYKIGEYISAQQLGKIENSIRQIGRELSEIKLK